MSSGKLIATWILGAVFLLFGSWILSNLQQTVGVDSLSYIFALLIALGCYLLAGLFWVSTSTGARH